MLRLIKKELMEKRFWALLSVVLSILVVLFGTGYTFVGSFDAFSIWAILPAFTLLIFGMTTFTAELSGAADFLYTKPISWWKIVITKIAAGLLVVIVSALLSCAIYAVVRPHQYAHLTTLSSLLTGTGWALLFTGLCYLIGVLVSVVIPGPAGGIAVLSATILLGCLSSAFWYWAASSEYDMGHLVFAWSAAIIAAFIFTARFGITLPLNHRIHRYGALIIGIVAIVTITDVCFSKFHCNHSNHGITSTSISPDANYALVTETFFISGKATNSHSESHLVRLSDGKTAVIRSNFRTAYWTPSNEIILSNDKKLTIAKMTAGGKIKTRMIPLPFMMQSFLQSPDLRFAVVWTNPPKTLYIVDVENGHKKKVEVKGCYWIWWQSNTEIGYNEKKDGKRHIVKVN